MKIKLNKWDLLPDRAAQDLYSVVTADHYVAMKRGEACPSEASALFNVALDDARKMFEKDATAWLDYRRELREEAERYPVTCPTRGQGGSFLRWPDGSTTEMTEPMPLPLPGWPSHEDRRKQYIRWRAFAFFGMYHIIPERGDLAVGGLPRPPLAIRPHLPEPDKSEVALRIAKMLVSESNPNRKRYRPSPRHRGKPNTIPTTLTEAVAGHMAGVLEIPEPPPPTVRGWLAGKFELPWDLMAKGND